MIRTKKRILAMLLAVVLCFSSLPFSVSADEISSEVPTESTVESQPEESQAEETKEPVLAENTITISDGSGDVPVLYAQDPFNTVKSEVEGGTNYMTSYGVTRQSIVQELESHEHDSFYLGTPYAGGDSQSPNGDTSYNDIAGMNCGGFIPVRELLRWPHVFWVGKAGILAPITKHMLPQTPKGGNGSSPLTGAFFQKRKKTGGV